EPIGALAEHVALEAGVDSNNRPMIYPTSDDQQAGLVGGGAVNDGQMAVILGTSAVVNSSSARLPDVEDLDVMCLNWGPYLLMRCYSNGAAVLNEAVGADKSWQKEDWARLEEEARVVPPGARGNLFLPFANAEPSLGISNDNKGLRWLARKGDQWAAGAGPRNRGVRRRASLESIAYMIALGVQSHEKVHASIGQSIQEITVSGGAARSDLMCEILASVLGRRLNRLQNEEGPALGAAVTALAAHESRLRREQGIDTPFTVADAVCTMVKYREPVDPNPRWEKYYEQGLNEFADAVRQL
ncbi:MAG: xylulose kinase, partial [Planctomycetes bacterium]|nr:xylulose kinase [Planctomycetota bacterium]